MISREVSLPELLSPAGNFEKLPYTLRFGADAVYFAGKAFGMRSAAGNFTDEELSDAISLVHSCNKKAYLTVNTMPRDTELKALTDYLVSISDNPPDGIILSDLGVLSLCKRILPNVPIHVSTQASVVNAETCKIWYQLGAKRIILARELTLADIESIRKKVPDDLELEAFVHGSMCVAYSGRCLLSNYFTGRDANRGACTQPCRWSYHFTEDSRPNEIMTIENHPDGSFIFGSKDLCMIEHLKELIDVGIASFKIEGRMKSAYYCASVTNVYRIVLDSIAGKRKMPEANAIWRELQSVSHREYSTGFFYHSSDLEPNLVSSNGYDAENSFLAEVIREAGERVYLCRQKNKFSVNEEIERLTPGSFGETFRVLSMKNENGENILNCPHPKMLFYIETDKQLSPGDLLRRKLEYFV